ncbi:MAG: hypothetical protein IJ660_01830, partial [Alphaproteobacteria bacterium]|nr:hypothetical protein [Alphaproteobacteria bacterium]
YKVNKTLDQISMLVTNIRSTFGNQNSYAGLSNTTAVTYELVDTDMSHGTTSTLKSAYNGDITIATTDSSLAFTITYASVPKGACASIASSNWGDSAASGLVSIKIGSTEHKWADSTNKLPIPFGTAASECTSDNANTIVWKYY